MQIWNTSNTAKPLIEEFESTINIWDVKWINEKRLVFGCGNQLMGTIEVNEINQSTKGANKPIRVIKAHDVNIEPSITLAKF